MVEVLEQLHARPLLEVFGGDQEIEFFFTKVFPDVCKKLLKSRYYK